MNDVIATPTFISAAYNQLPQQQKLLRQDTKTNPESNEARGDKQ